MTEVGCEEEAYGGEKRSRSMQLIPTISSTLSEVHSSLEAERRLAYSRSSIALVSAVENKYPLADIIMKR